METIQQNPEPYKIETIQQNPEPNIKGTIQQNPEPYMMETIQQNPEPYIMGTIQQNPAPYMMKPIQQNPEPYMMGTIQQIHEPYLMAMTPLEAQPMNHITKELPADKSAEDPDSVSAVDFREPLYLEEIQSISPFVSEIRKGPTVAGMPKVSASSPVSVINLEKGAAYRPTEAEVSGLVLANTQVNSPGKVYLYNALILGVLISFANIK